MPQAALKRAPEAPDATESPAVRFRDVTVRFTTERGAVTALDRVSMSVAQGGFLTLLGPSGCGKSTLLRVVSDLVPATSGQVEVMGASAAAAREARNIGFVFQDASLLAWRTALENVEFTARTKDHGWGSFDPAVWEAQIDQYDELKQFQAGKPKPDQVMTTKILDMTENERPKIG